MPSPSRALAPARAPPQAQGPRLTRPATTPLAESRLAYCPLDPSPLLTSARVTRLPTVEHHITSPARPSRPPPPRYRVHVGLAMGADEDYIGGVSTEELCRKNHFCP